MCWNGALLEEQDVQARRHRPVVAAAHMFHAAVAAQGHTRAREAAAAQGGRGEEDAVRPRRLARLLARIICVGPYVELEGRPAKSCGAELHWDPSAGRTGGLQAAAMGVGGGAEGERGALARATALG